MATAGYSSVKVFSATRARDREDIGERVTAWLAEHPEVTVTEALVRQSSDASYHCISIVLLTAPAGTANG
jgi:folate-dependent tRNA-U54 methylase TrmFO/GidA